MNTEGSVCSLMGGLLFKICKQLLAVMNVALCVVGSLLQGSVCVCEGKFYRVPKLGWGIPSTSLYNKGFPLWYVCFASSGGGTWGVMETSLFVGNQLFCFDAVDLCVVLFLQAVEVVPGNGNLPILFDFLSDPFLFSLLLCFALLLRLLRLLCHQKELECWVGGWMGG